jgi:carbamoyltransferase
MPSCVGIPGMIVLGLTAPLSHNTAACIVVDGELIAFCEEERFVGIKHAPRYVPKNAITYCLHEANVRFDDVDYVALGYDSVFKGALGNFARNILEGNYRRSILEQGAFAEYFLQMYRQMDFFCTLTKRSRREIAKKLIFVQHHVAHAASAARCSGFDATNIITLDGVGEAESGSFGYMRDNRVVKLGSVGINQSLGWFYSTVTGLLGFKEHSHEGKTMGLAPYGTPDPRMLEGVAELTPTGWKLAKDLPQQLLMRMGERRKRDEPLTDKHKCLAASAQQFLEGAAKRRATWLYKKTGIRNVCLAGGVALNCDMNSKLWDLDWVENIYVQPASNDAGTALGAALEVYAQKSGKPCAKISHSFYGPKYGDAAIESVLLESKLGYRRLKSLREAAQMIADGKIVGWVQGRMEFGPRALGGRSIVAHPGLAGMKDKINGEVKHREDWRPFAPSVLEEHAASYFKAYYPSPFMLMTFEVFEEKKADIAEAVHVDNTARVQGVTRAANPRYYDLIKEFFGITGIPVVLNTSFNDKEKPISMSPRDALQTFFTTGLDVLILEDFVLEKIPAQQAQALKANGASHQQTYSIQ